MTKKNNTRTGKLFSPEYRETLKRMKNAPPELEAIVERERMIDAGELDGDRAARHARDREKTEREGEHEKGH